MAGQPGEELEPPFVSTGRLPRREQVQAWVEDAYAACTGLTHGEVSPVYPALSEVPSDLFGISVVSCDGGVVEVGDVTTEFTIMSVAKPFVLALVCEALGAETVRAAVGVNATGLPFDSLTAIEQAPDGRTNPMVNPGAIATTALTPGSTPGHRWAFLADGLSRFAGRDLELQPEVLASASATNHTNRRLARVLAEHGALTGDPEAAVELYTRQSCLAVTAHDLATMGATLADGGINPLSGERVVSAATCRHALAVMATAGLYQTSGDWLFTVGLPAKSGIGGGIVTAAPGKGGLGAFSPPLDAAGNSVRGVQAARLLSDRLGLDLFASEPLGRT